MGKRQSNHRSAALFTHWGTSSSRQKLEPETQARPLVGLTTGSGPAPEDAAEKAGGRNIVEPQGKNRVADRR